MRYKAAQERLRAADARNDAKVADHARSELNALVLFKHDMTGFPRMYAFLSQIFDYRNTAMESGGGSVQEKETAVFQTHSRHPRLSHVVMKPSCHSGRYGYSSMRSTFDADIRFSCQL